MLKGFKIESTDTVEFHAQINPEPPQRLLPFYGRKFAPRRPYAQEIKISIHKRVKHSMTFLFNREQGFPHRESSAAVDIAYASSQSTSRRFSCVGETRRRFVR